MQCIVSPPSFICDLRIQESLSGGKYPSSDLHQFWFVKPGHRHLVNKRQKATVSQSKSRLQNKLSYLAIQPETPFLLHDWKQFERHLRHDQHKVINLILILLSCGYATHDRHNPYCHMMHVQVCAHIFMSSIHQQGKDALFPCRICAEGSVVPVSATTDIILHSFVDHPFMKDKHVTIL